MLKATEQVLNQLKVKHVGNSFAPLGETDYTSHLLKARASKADGVIMIFYGADEVKCAKQAHEFGLKKQSALLHVWSALDVLREKGADVAEGAYHGVQAWHETNSPVTRHVVAKYRQKYGQTPGYQALSYYTVTKVLFDTIEKAGKAEPEAAIPLIEDREFDGPNGRERFRKWDHQNQKPFFLMKGKPKSVMKDPDDFLELVASEALYPSQDENSCRL